jgi:hypothetical protein
VELGLSIGGKLGERLIQDIDTGQYPALPVRRFQSDKECGSLKKNRLLRFSSLDQAIEIDL